MSARVVVITDRKRFASEEIAGRIAAILAAVPRGSVAIQIREKDLDGGPLLRLAREIVEVARPAGAEVWINDRVDLALILGADGVHLPEQGLAVADARELCGAMMLGASRHSEAGALAAAEAGADLVQVGPIFDSPDKQAVGTAILAVRARMPKAVAVVAVGGIDTPERARRAAAAGADAVAVIRAAWTRSSPEANILRLIEAVDTGRRERS